MRQSRAHVPRDERHCRIKESLWFILLWLEMAWGWLVGEQVACAGGGAGVLDAVLGDTYGVSTCRGLALPPGGTEGSLYREELRLRQGSLFWVPLRPCQAASLWLSVPLATTVCPGSMCGTFAPWGLLRWPPFFPLARVSLNPASSRSLMPPGASSSHPQPRSGCHHPPRRCSGTRAHAAGLASHPQT